MKNIVCGDSFVGQAKSKDLSEAPLMWQADQRFAGSSSEVGEVAS